MRAALCVVLMASVGFAAPPKKPRPESSYVLDAKGNRLPPGKVNLLGNTMDFAKFAKTCQPRTGKGISTGGFDSQAVKITGPILDVVEGDAGGWRIATKWNATNRAWEEPVIVVLTEIGGNEGAESGGFRVGNMVNVYGVVVPGTGAVSAWYAELVPPGLQWQVALRDPGTLRPGMDQTFVVDCVVKNTGKQPVREVKFAVRLLQTQSPNDEVEVYTIPAMAPGETARFSVEFDWFNYTAIGLTSMPKGQAKVIGYEL